MFARPSYGFGKPVSTEILEVLHRWMGSDGLLRDISIVRWTFGSGTAVRRRICRVYQSFRRCKTGGREFPGYEGRWAWTGERFTEPRADEPFGTRTAFLLCPVCGENGHDERYHQALQEER